MTAPVEPVVSPDVRGRSILDTMARLRLATTLPLSGLLDRPLDLAAETEPFRVAVETLRAQRGARPVRPPSVATLERARSRWAECSPDVVALGPRYTRALCSDVGILDDAAFVQGIARHPELPRRRRWLESLVALYEATWRTPAHVGVLERALRDAVAHGDARSARLDAVRPAAARFFSADAARWLSDQAVNGRCAPQEVLGRYGVPQDSALARAVADAAAVAWIRELCEHRTVTSGTLALLAYGLKSILPSATLADATLRETVGRAIEWAPERDERVGDLLRPWLLDDRRFGDPRLPANQSNWGAMSARARARMIQWLARGDLIFFFDFVLTPQRDFHGRKAFWLRYVDQVADSAVALSPMDVERLKLSVTEKLRFARAESPSGDVSAFVMRFRGRQEFVVAEFSEYGNAAYIHDARLFDEHVGGMRARRYAVSTMPRGLKSSTAHITKYSHTEGWQRRVEPALANLGLRARS